MGEFADVEHTGWTRRALSFSPAGWRLETCGGMRQTWHAAARALAYGSRGRWGGQGRIDGGWQRVTRNPPSSLKRYDILRVCVGERMSWLEAQWRRENVQQFPQCTMGTWCSMAVTWLAACKTATVDRVGRERSTPVERSSSSGSGYCFCWATRPQSVHHMPFLAWLIKYGKEDGDGHIV
jgi:hypothetical protein